MGGGGGVTMWCSEIPFGTTRNISRRFMPQKTAWDESMPLFPLDSKGISCYAWIAGRSLQNKKHFLKSYAALKEYKGINRHNVEGFFERVLYFGSPNQPSPGKIGMLHSDVSWKSDSIIVTNQATPQTFCQIYYKEVIFLLSCFAVVLWRNWDQKPTMLCSPLSS